MDNKTQQRLRRLPKVDVLLSSGPAEALARAHGRAATVDAARAVLDEVREELLGGAGNGAPGAEAILSRVEARLALAAIRSLRRVVNATGIVLHTNLGRAPLSSEAIAAVGEVAGGYSNLEYDLAAGGRGSRQTHIESLLRRLTGAEAAVVVNNNAAAVMLAVNTVARDGEVITSRGELIEIGGSFRIPEVIETSEARLVETGTTNRTRVSDFANALNPRTRALLRVHPSNYQIVGFTESAPREELVALARERNIAAIEDLGSGTLIDLATFGLPAEPTVQEAVRSGMGVVTFSGDKLLGGPQAGIAVGRAEIVEQMRRNPLYRALRVDKMTLAALETTLREYLAPDRVAERVPVLRMLAQSPQELDDRARRLAAQLPPGCEASVESAEGYAGGGSLPGQAMADVVVAVSFAPHSADELHAALRRGDPPVVTRIADGRVLLQMRTVRDDELPLVAAAFARLGK